MNDDFLLDDEEGDYLDQIIDSSQDREDDDGEESSTGSVIADEDSFEKVEVVDDSIYKGSNLSESEIWLISAYNDIVAAGKNNAENAISDAVTIVIMANPKHTSSTTIGHIVKDVLHKQGHARMVNSLYTPDSIISGEEVDLDFKDEDDLGFNSEYAAAARDQVARFIDYLATRDLSKDSIIAKRAKQRHIPAFIILLFSSGMYDLIIDCPTMPEEYAFQIKRAFQKIMNMKLDIVDALADRYDKEGRTAVADRVRLLGTAWFAKEPAEIMTAGDYSDLDLKYGDVLIYREFRSKYTNVSKAITQDVISDLIEVVIDKKSGVFEKLKDKTRSLAISDVKQVYTDWSKDNPYDAELTSKVIYKDEL